MVDIMDSKQSITLTGSPQMELSRSSGFPSTLGILSRVIMTSWVSCKRRMFSPPFPISRPITSSGSKTFSMLKGSHRSCDMASRPWQEERKMERKEVEINWKLIPLNEMCSSVNGWIHKYICLKKEREREIFICTSFHWYWWRKTCNEE